ncbi:hypothetical protein SAMN04489725_1512 [Alicyclobacillus hesperidum]|uniref:Transposase n=1 Tax=Alicyclobacillus hesperidum TaxID=89784 RepID=A0A1H2YQQ7_9BACL|nr:hypothetical protein [Alicyclobacillus hesperidum]SDX06859.1 hypothetical protein SAMN04489725_1512 [Alicyclobacillus hesperidum]
MPEHMSRQERHDLWRERIGSFYGSGLSAAQYCAEHGLKPHQLWYWVKRFRDEASKARNLRLYLSSHKMQASRLRNMCYSW